MFVTKLCMFVQFAIIKHFRKCVKSSRIISQSVTVLLSTGTSYRLRCSDSSGEHVICDTYKLLLENRTIETTI